MRQFPTFLCAILVGLASAPIEAWTPGVRPGFKLDTLWYSTAGGAYQRVASYDSLGRIADSTEWTVQTNGVTDYIQSWSYKYVGTDPRFTKRIHFAGTPSSWYSGTRTRDTGNVRRDHEGRDSCMDVSGTKIGSYGTAGGSSARISTPCAIRWDASGRKTYDATGNRPESWGYDPKGNVVTDTSWYSTTPSVTKFGYDEQGRMIYRVWAMDTTFFSYSEDGWRLYMGSSDEEPRTWHSLEISGDTAKFILHGDRVGSMYWFIKDRWGDTIEQGTAHTDTGFVIQRVDRDSLVRDASGNVILAMHHVAYEGHSEWEESTRFVWSPSRAETGVGRALPKQSKSVVRVEWVDLQGHLLGGSDKPGSGPTMSLHRARSGPMFAFERGFDRDGNLVATRRILIR
jgi:YD repeat-containing protein